LTGSSSAYVVGRAGGILLGVGPSPGEALALMLVVAVMIRTAAGPGSPTAGTSP
jgi:hypothetical protein